MRPVSNETRSYHFGKTSFENRSLGDSYSNTLKLLQQADTVELFQIFKFYQLKLTAHNNIIRCPFSFHRDRTPSFYFYSATNTFHCFGCQSNGGPVKFVMLMDDLKRTQAAQKILAHFEPNSELHILDSSYAERVELYFKFSSLIRNFIRINQNDPQALKLADQLTLIFDRMTAKHKLELEGLQLLIESLEQKILQY